MPRDSADNDFITTLSGKFPTDMFARAEQSYLEEPRGRFQGAQGFVARPRNTQEVSALVKACGEAGVGIVPYGGGTGLATQRECLEVMDCYGKGKVKKFAEVVASAALAGELSLGAAISSSDWVSSHETYGRNR